MAERHGVYAVVDEASGRVLWVGLELSASWALSNAAQREHTTAARLTLQYWGLRCYGPDAMPFHWRHLVQGLTPGEGWRGYDPCWLATLWQNVAEGSLANIGKLFLRDPGEGPHHRAAIGAIEQGLQHLHWAELYAAQINPAADEAGVDPQGDLLAGLAEGGE